MNRRPEQWDSSAVIDEDSPGRFCVCADFDQVNNPELFQALGRVPKGKARANRLRDIALVGLMTMKANRVSSLQAAPDAGKRGEGKCGGAGGVFDEPLTE